MSETNNETGYQLINTKFNDLKRSPIKFYQTGTRSIVWFENRTMDVAVMISKCPNCDFEVEWLTTGLLPGSLMCENCKTPFLI